jgi:hypothetical protein
MKSFWTRRKSSHLTAVFRNANSRKERQQHQYSNTADICCVLAEDGAEFKLDRFIGGGLLELIVI